RIQHLFWRHREPDHPANRGEPVGRWAGVIAEHYRECDALVGCVAAAVGEDTLLAVVSDHGFGSFRRGVHLNTWLHDHGWLALRDGLRPGPDVPDLLRAVAWDRTRAYAVGLGGIYLNLKGREGRGLVAPGDEAARLAQELAARLCATVDPQTGA